MRMSVHKTIRVPPPKQRFLWVWWLGGVVFEVLVEFADGQMQVGCVAEGRRCTMDEKVEIWMVGESCGVSEAL